MINLFVDGCPVRSDEEFETLKQVFPEYERFDFQGIDEEGHYLFKCRFLNGDFLCADHRRRPFICRKYPDQKLLLLGGKLVSKCGYSFLPVKDFGKVLDEITAGKKQE